MKMHTKAYGRYRKEVISLWNFAVMVCYAVPTLSKNIHGVEKNIEHYSMVQPDFFRYDKTTPEILKGRIKSYQHQLTSYLWLSTFSFFEAYVKQILGELIEFHGGKDKFIQDTIESIGKDMSQITHRMKQHRIKLQKPFDPRKILQYKKKTKILKEGGYKFPSELLAAFGVKMLIERLGDLRAKDIPTLLRDGLLFEFDDESLKKFNSYNAKRNNIAHGESVKYSLHETKEMLNFLRNLAKKIDQHLMANFFVIEKYKSDL